MRGTDRDDSSGDRVGELLASTVSKVAKTGVALAMIALLVYGLRTVFERDVGTVETTATVVGVVAALAVLTVAYRRVWGSSAPREDRGRA